MSDTITVTSVHSNVIASPVVVSGPSTTIKLIKNALVMFNKSGNPVLIKGKPCSFRRVKKTLIRDTRDGSYVTADYLKSELMRMVKNEDEVMLLMRKLFSVSDDEIAAYEAEHNEKEEYKTIDDAEIPEAVVEEDEIVDEIEQDLQQREAEEN